MIIVIVNMHVCITFNIMSHAYCIFCFTKIHPNGRHRTKFNPVCLHFFNLRKTQLLGLFITKINHTSTHSSCYVYKITRLTIQRVLDKQNNSFRESVFLFIAQTIWCKIKTDWLRIFFILPRHRTNEPQPYERYCKKKH